VRNRALPRRPRAPAPLPTPTSRITTSPLDRELHAKTNRTQQGFAANDFTIDWDNQQAVCPTGKTSATWTPNIQNGVPKTVVTFAALDCIPCPSKQQCTSSLYPRELTEAVQETRARQQTKDWNKGYALSAGVEGSSRQATHTTGLRRARYRGLAKIHLDHTHQRHRPGGGRRG
jgi:hypothetical protein